MAVDAATALEGLCLADTSITDLCSTESGSVSETQAVGAVAALTTQTSKGKVRLNRGRVKRMLKEIARLTKALHGQSRRFDLGRIIEHDLRSKEESLDKYILKILGPECVKLFEQMLIMLPYEIRDIVYSVIFQDTVSEVRMFRATKPRSSSKVSFNAEAFDFCRRPGTADHKWLFDLFSAHDNILADLMSAWARHN